MATLLTRQSRRNPRTAAPKQKPTERRRTMFNLIPWRKNKNGGMLASRTDESAIARLRDEFESLFDRFFNHWPTPFESTLGRESFWGFDMEDCGNEIVVRAEAPGFDASDFDCEISGNLLTIKAEKRHAFKGRRNGHDEERHYATFRRIATLPPGILADKIEARYHNGVLEVRVPKSEETKAKRITVRS
jgi:HSP20 family protein